MTRPRSWCSCASPKRSAWSMVMMVAFGMFIPTSTTVVQTRMSVVPSLNCSITSCFSFAFILPCRTSIVRSGNMFLARCLYSSSTDRSGESSSS